MRPARQGRFCPREGPFGTLLGRFLHPIDPFWHRFSCDWTPSGETKQPPPERSAKPPPGSSARPPRGGPLPPSRTEPGCAAEGRRPPQATCALASTRPLGGGPGWPVRPGWGSPPRGRSGWPSGSRADGRVSAAAPTRACKRRSFVVPRGVACARQVGDAASQVPPPIDGPAWCAFDPYCRIEKNTSYPPFPQNGSP